MTDKTIITLTGPTCSGKSTIERELRKLGWGAVRSFTTRPQRDNEVDGHHYDFVTESQIVEWVNAKQIVEVVRFGAQQHFYGSTKERLEEAFIAGDGKVVVVCEPNGANQFGRFCKDNNIRHVGIYISAPVEVLIKRMLDRFLDDTNADSANYAKRLLGISEETRTWQSELNDMHWMAYQNENYTLADVPRIAAAIHGVSSVPVGYLKAT